jgi:glucose/arabinose dehydrogenase
MKKNRTALLATAVLASLTWACALPGSASDGAWNHEVVNADLAYPWDIQRSGERLFITEVAGHIVTMAGNRSQRAAVQTSEPVVHDGGSGLLGMALASDFERSGTAYVFHTVRTSTGLANKVIEVRHDNGQWRETRVLLRGIPGHTLYNGGRIAIGPDAHLYVTTGWVRDPASAQDLNSLAGKVLRLRLDGGVPPDNPFTGSYVWSYGHRNPQGLAWSSDGRLFVAEHGESGHDEVNLVTRGGNYGWPGTVGDQRRAGVTPPLSDSGSRTWAPSGVAFFEGKLLIAALADRSLQAFDLGNGSMQLVFRSGDRLRAVLPVGDALYVITTNTSPRAHRLAGPDRLMKLTRKR